MHLQLHTPRHHAYLSAVADDGARRILVRFVERIARVDLNLADDAGTRGGVHLRASGVVVLRDGSTAMVSGRYVDERSAVTQLLHRLRGALRRLVGRRRERRRT